MAFAFHSIYSISLTQGDEVLLFNMEKQIDSLYISLKMTRRSALEGGGINYWDRRSALGHADTVAIIPDKLVHSSQSKCNYGPLEAWRRRSCRLLSPESLLLLNTSMLIWKGIRTIYSYDVWHLMCNLYLIFHNMPNL